MKDKAIELHIQECSRNPTLKSEHFLSLGFYSIVLSDNLLSL
jgi:hypothetical protein